MTETRLKRFYSVPAKRDRLLEILSDPIFMEATELVCDRVNQPILSGPTESAAVFGAFVSGVRQAFRELEALPTGFAEKEDPKPKKKPWEHYTQEPGLYGTPNQPKQPTK
jgi:hypothetical protein